MITKICPKKRQKEGKKKIWIILSMMPETY
jgi:hypothetical protein